MITPDDLNDVEVEPTNLVTPEPEPDLRTHTQILADVSVEYSVALAEMEYLKPQYEAAVKRYVAARQAMTNFVYDRDAEINIY